MLQNLKFSLLLVLLGAVLFTIVFHRQSLGLNLFLLEVVVLTLSSLVNWDGVIARYNFSHAGQSWLHLEFLSDLSAKTLPELDRPLEELQRLDAIQDSLFPFSANYMSPESYLYHIHGRKSAFLLDWEATSIWEWNCAESAAYHRLSGKH